MENHKIDELAKEITAQYVAQTKGAEQATHAAELAKLQRAKAAMVMLRNKMILWAVTGLVMTGSLVYIGVAWYTRIANTHAVTFEVADYDLAVNDNTDNEFLVNVYSYNNIVGQHAAPGTDGYIPLRLSGRHSEISIDYSISMESMMMPSLEDHFRFFVLVKEDGTPVVCDLKDVIDEDEKPTGEKVIIDEHKQYFLTSFSEEEDSQLATLRSQGITKKYIAPEDAEPTLLKGTLEMNAEKVIYIYWEWYLDAEDAMKTSENGLLKENYTKEAWDALSEAWDAVDTEVGRNPEKYIDSMILHITCEGIQSNPDLKTPQE